MKRSIIAVAIILLIAAEMSRVYFIMPFPGSQRAETINYAYWIHNNLLWIRLLLFAVIIFLLRGEFRKLKVAGKILLTLGLAIYFTVFYFFNFRFQADKMFLQPTVKSFAGGAENKVQKNKLVLGVAINGEAKAYPIQYIGYHHQLRDTVGNIPVMITYCTVCRTGRVFSPEVDGKPEQFRLVGMDHFNAMFEDRTTGSWWRQVTGEAVAGPRAGSYLRQLPSEQSTLENWLLRHPGTLIFQGDTVFNKQYASLKDFDNGTTDDKLEKRDSASWLFKSWVIGVSVGGAARAYDWNRITQQKIINDTLAAQPLLLTLESDTANFHVMRRVVDNEALVFRPLNDTVMTDVSTGSSWTLAGNCFAGPMQGRRLTPVTASQEFWHSWKTFNPFTTKY